MKNNREIALILLAMTLLSILIVIWIRSVYLKEIQTLMTETNIEFIRALEDTENELIFNSPALSKFGQKHKQLQELLPQSDSMNVRHVQVMEFSKDHFNHEGKPLNKGIIQKAKLSTNDSSRKLIVTIDARHSEISIDGSAAVRLDIDSVTNRLQSFFSNRLDSGRLSGLRFKVIEGGMDSSFQASFITDPAGLSNVFFSENEYIAAVDFGIMVILSRMIPEIIFAILLFLAIAGAFYSIYKNLDRERRLALLKDEFVSNITHELKTPISIVNVAVEALSNFKGLEDRKRTDEYLDISKRELQRLDHMVDHILDISKEDANVEYPPELISVGQEIHELIESTGLDTERIKIGPHPKELYINMNPSLFSIVIHNLLDNAIKYDPSGGDIGLELSNTKENIEISIRDHGIGIAEDQLESVFDKFYRVPTHNIHDVKGHGLGLYYVRKHVESAGGKVKAMNMHPGTKFILQIPKANAN